MQFGFGVLHLSPDAFWRMTPRELAHAIAAVRGRAAAAIARGDFDALMQAFPDGSASLRAKRSNPETSTTGLLRRFAPRNDVDG